MTVLLVKGLLVLSMATAASSLADPQQNYYVPNYYYGAGGVAGYTPDSSIVYVDYQQPQTPLYYNQYYPNYRDYAYNYNNNNNRDLWTNYGRNWYGYGYNYNPNQNRYGWIHFTLKPTTRDGSIPLIIYYRTLIIH